MAAQLGGSHHPADVAADESREEREPAGHRPASAAHHPPAGHPPAPRPHRPVRAPGRSGATGPGHGPGGARAPPRLLARLQVTGPGDPWEVEAEAVAALVRRGHGKADGCGHGRRAGLPAAAGRHWHEELDAARADTVAAALAPSGAGSALPRAVRDRIEPVLGVDLSGVRVRHDEASGAAARTLGARAFTVGRTIHLAPSSSPSDVGLIAHEATHVAQQGLASPRAPPVVMRDVSDYLPDIDVGDVIPDWVIDGVRSAVRSVPGYTALSYVVGEDLLTGERVSVDTEALIDAVLTYGPFGPAVGTVLRGLSIVQEIYEAVVARFTAHDLTLGRIGRDLESAWDEVSVTKGIDGNVAVLRRYVNAFLDDLLALVDELIDLVLTLVREAVIAVAEPFLETPAIAPVWNLVKEVLHYDPLRGVEVQVPTTRIIADFLTLIGQSERLEQMRERGTLQETADWLDLQMVTFLSIATDLSTLFSDAWEALQPRNLPDLFDTLPGLADRAIGLVGRIVEFGTSLIAQVLELIKNALLGWLSEHAHELPGFHLLTVIIRRNPFTGEAVPRTATNLIRGFITLLPGGEATYAELSQAGVIGDAADRIEGAMARLGISWEMVVATFTGIWESLGLDDLLHPIAAFDRVVAQFGAPVSRIIEFIGVVLEVVVTLILRLMNFPTELLGSVVSNAMAAMADIRRDPVGFLVNMLAALKLGFSNFFANIGGYLLDGLVAWLFRGLGQIGITIPGDLSFGSILGLVLDVLGLSVEYLWAKLGEHIGEERVAQVRGALDTLGEAWQFLRDVQREGLPAIWRFLSDQLSNLWQTLLDAALDWITRIVVTRATARLLSMLDPTGIMAVINSAVAIFDAVQSAIEYLRDLLEVLNTYVSTLAAIAAGNVQPGAQMLEQGLAAIIPIAIGFLANQVGLGNMPEKIVELIGSLREMVDQAVDWLIRQALRLGRAALSALGVGGQPGDDADPGGEAPGAISEPVPMADQTHQLRDDGPGGALVLHTDPVLVSSLTDAALQGLVTTFNTSTTQTAKKAAALAVAQWMAANMPATGPGGSAPNLGRIGRHGSQPPRLVDSGVPLWSLRSEHVVPFTVVRGLWEALGVEAQARRRQLGSEDRTLTTIMIYMGAGNAKDVAEADQRRAAGQHLDALTAAYVQQSDADTPAADAEFRGRVMTYLRTQRTLFTNLTWDKVREEHAAPSGSTTHGALRAETAALPTVADIGSAAGTELDDAERILDSALADLARP